MTGKTATDGVLRAEQAATVSSVSRAPSTRWIALPMLFATVATAMVAMTELSKPSPWRDEAVTLGVSTRSFGQIIHLSKHIDGVLTPYYLAMHVLLGHRPDVYLARLPSVAATALTAGVLVVLAARLFGLRAAYLAGALFAVLPMTSRYAQEARPYAITGLVAVLATLLLLRALETGSTGWFASYGVAMVLLSYVNLIAILLLAGHAVTVGLFRRRDLLRRWLICAVMTVLAATPLIWAGSHETVALKGLSRPTLQTLSTLVAGMSGDWTAFWWLATASALGWLVLWVRYRYQSTGRTLGSARSARSARSVSWSVVWPWLVIPPTLLFALSQIRPLYADRYLVFCLPAFVLIIAGAVSKLPWPIPVALLVVVASITMRTQHNIRSEAGHTEDLRNLAKFEIAMAHPGDGLLYLPARLRVIEGAYPDMVRDADDVALAQSPAASGTLEGTEIPPAAVAAAVAAHRRVWVVTSTHSTMVTPTDPAKLPALAKNYHLAWRHIYRGDFVLELYKHN